MDARRIAERIGRVVSGPMWHGPALDEVMDGTTAAEAAARPVPGAHTAWELVLHMTTWARIARERLASRRPVEATEAEDWPPMPAEPTEAAWRDVVEALRASHRELAGAAAALDAAALAATVPGRDHTVADMLHGVVEHGCYHGGQFALLVRAARYAP